MVGANRLNPEQKRAVEATEGPVLIIAGAGSGKTRVLTERIKNLIINHQVDPRNILAVTFTNKAAKEMKSRLPSEYQYPWIGTFHSICHKILRLERDKPFVIFDSSDQHEVVKSICKQLDVPAQYKPASILAAISNAKNVLQTPADFAGNIQSIYEENVARVYIEYQKILQSSNALDFDDLLNETVFLLQDRPEVLQKYQARFRYISVDEYQDTNYAQFLITKLLAEKHQNICVVGDADQNIYSWRGANIENILNFERDFAQAQVILLEQNYRSTKAILLIANAVIAQNMQRKAKNLWTDNDEGCPATLYTAYDGEEEASYLAGHVVKHDNPNEVVVLYRTNAQSRAIEEAFLKRSINYRIVGGLKFYLRKEIKDVLSYVRNISHPEDPVAAARVRKLPAYKKYLAAIPTLAPEKKPSKLIQKILALTKYQEKLNIKATEDALARAENIEELIGVAKNYDNIEDFLTFTSLVTDLDQLEEGPNAVTLMTLHSAKGLEYDHVYIAGCEDGLLPHYRSQTDPAMMEEERRLFYVGITRARQNLTFSAANKRSIFGETWYNEKSRFLKEIPASLLQTEDFMTTETSREPQVKVSPVSIFNKGDMVRHRRFGEGVIKALSGDDLIINFPAGEKLLSAKYAPLEKV